MAEVTRTYTDRWRSRRHVGAAKPVQAVSVRLGKFDRRYDAWQGYDVNATMVGQSNSKPWQAFWTPTTDWSQLPNLIQVDLDKDFDNDGIGTATITMDNIFVQEQNHGFGIFHAMKRGWFSPLRGYVGPYRGSDPEMELNDWYRYLTRDAQIRVEQGYGDEQPETFVGLIDDVDFTSSPDIITITCRDFGQTLTDQNLMGYVIEPELAHLPVIFADRRSKDVDRTWHEGTASKADCSTYEKPHDPRNVCNRLNGADTDFWASELRDAPNITQYVQIRVPHGRYESFYLQPGYKDMEMFVSVYAKSKNISTKEGKCRVDGVPVDDGWLQFETGGGTVPGDHGGVPYTKRYPSLPVEGRFHPFGHKLELGDDSIIRVSFRNLREVHDKGRHGYRATVRRLFGVRRKRKPEVTKGKWILVDDISDIVKVVLRWAGFKEWEIESTGTRLPQQLTFHNSETLRDIIAKCQEITGYAFFMGDPSGGEDEASIGVPIFRTPRVLAFDPGGVQVKDTDLLTGVQAKFTNDSLPSVIHVRGKVVKKGTEGAHRLGEDPNIRLMSSYQPPWYRNGSRANIIRRFIHTYQHLTTQYEVEVAARMVALNGALQSFMGTIEIPGNAQVDLDAYIGVRDVGTGMNARFYVSNRASSFRSGRNASYKMTLGGAVVDNPDVEDAARELIGYLIQNSQEEKGAVPTSTGGKRQRGQRGERVRAST